MTTLHSHSRHDSRDCIDWETNLSELAVTRTSGHTVSYTNCPRINDTKTKYISRKINKNRNVASVTARINAPALDLCSKTECFSQRPRISVHAVAGLFGRRNIFFRPYTLVFYRSFHAMAYYIGSLEPLMSY